MQFNPKHVALLFDSHIPIDEISDWELLIATDNDWKDERDVLHTLQYLGHRVTVLPIHKDSMQTLNTLKNEKPDLVFFMCESIGSDRQLAINLSASIELLGIPCTGASAEAQYLCQDKALSKSVLRQAGVPTPEFEIVKRGKAFLNTKKFPGPYIVKPLGLESSEGISLKSICQNQQEVQLRIKELGTKWRVDCIIEQFIEGRELYIAALGTPDPLVLPIQELFFGKLPDHQHRIASYKAKWDKNYRATWGIDSDSAKHINQNTLLSMQNATRKAVSALKLNHGYVRFDLRMNADDEFYFLEANPNPSIHKIEDFSEAAREYGWTYPMLIQNILDLCKNQSK